MILLRPSFSPETSESSAFRLEFNPTISRASIILLALVGGTVIIPQILTHPQSFPVDFNYLWGAGKMWAQFQSPYSAEYSAFLNEQSILQYEGASVPYFYPPNSILMVAPLGLLSLQSASVAFTLANLAALIASSLLFARITKLIGVSIDLAYPFLLHLGLISAGWYAGKIIFAYNAPMLITYLGVIMVLYSILSQRSWYLIIGLVIVLIKPQIGIALLIQCLLSPSLRRSAFFAVGITGLASIIGLLPGGVIQSLQNFFGNLSVYSGFYANLTEHTSGLGFAIYVFTGHDLSAFLLLSLMIGFILSYIFWLTRKNPASPERDFAFAAFTIAVACVFLPSHNNYLIVFMPVLLWLTRDARPFELFLWIPAIALIMRGWDIAQLATSIEGHSFLFFISTTDTVATFAIFVAVALKIHRQYIVQSPSVPTSSIQS